MWHKAMWKGHPMKLELTRVGLLGELVNNYTTRGAFCVKDSYLKFFLRLLFLVT